MAWLNFSDELYEQIIGTSQEEDRNPGTLITADIWNYTISTIHYNIKEIADLLKAHTHILWEDVEDKPAVLANIGENEAGEFTHKGTILRDWTSLLNRPAALTNLSEVGGELAHKGTVLRRWASILNKPEVIAHLSEDAVGNLLYKGKIVIPYDGTIEIPPPELSEDLQAFSDVITHNDSFGSQFTLDGIFNVTAAAFARMYTTAVNNSHWLWLTTQLVGGERSGIAIAWGSSTFPAPTAPETIGQGINITFDGAHFGFAPTQRTIFCSVPGIDLTENTTQEALVFARDVTPESPELTFSWFVIGYAYERVATVP